MSDDAEVRVRLCKGSGLVSGAIEYFGGVPFSHIDNVMPDGWLLGARSDERRIGTRVYAAGVQRRPPNYLGSQAYVELAIPCSQLQKSEWMSFLLSQVGKPYDKLAIVAFALERNWRDDDSWFCSELATRALEVAGICPELVVHPNKITPGGFALIAGARGGHPVSLVDTNGRAVALPAR